MDPTSTGQLTIDLDNSRINSSPSIVEDGTGRLIAFYSKVWNSGRLSDGIITFTPGSLNFSVPVGNGTINGVPVTWSLTNLTTPAGSYSMVYVDNVGLVHVTNDFPMSLYQNTIVLAMIYSGGSTITDIEQIEKTGHYIFVQKQIPSGSSWVWESDLTRHEYRLNAGIYPSSTYDYTNDLIYLTYFKNSNVYVRSIDPNSELTFEYIRPINIVTNNITLKRDPDGYTKGSFSSAVNSIVNIYSNIYPLIGGGLTFITGEPYFMLPKIGGDFLIRINSDVTYEVFYYDNGYILETSYVVSNPNSQNWYKAVPSIGMKYIGIRLRSSLYLEDYTTHPDFYVAINVFENYYNIDTEGNVEISSELVRGSLSLTSFSIHNVSYSYDQLQALKNESISGTFSSSVFSLSEISYSYDQLRDLKNENVFGSISFSGNSIVTINNI